MRCARSFRAGLQSADDRRTARPSFSCWRNIRKMGHVDMTRFASLFAAGVVALGLAGAAVAAPPPPFDPNNPQVDIHDPAMGVDHGTYYLYSTGMGITFYASKDRVHWEHKGEVFPQLPEWARKYTGPHGGAIWAPDVSEHNGKYYLYYSVSGFGKNHSAIGLAINDTLDPSSPKYKWVDKGEVLHSVPGRDLWNAIDPNLIVDDHGTAWMDFGSFWSGIKLVKLNASMTAPADPQQWYSIARRNRPPYTDDSEAGPGEIEGPFIFHKGQYYYLFVSTGLCCRGIHSTYRIAFGRSKTVTGPYLDEKGVDMAKGGGTPLLPEDKKWAGWGGQSVYHFDGADYVVFHAYENADNDYHRLKIEKIHWKDGWPSVDPHAIDTFRGWKKK